MNKRCFLLILLLLFSFPLLPMVIFGQQSHLDSLKKELLHSEGNTKILILLEIAEDLDNEDAELAIKYVNEAFGIAQQIENRALIAECQAYLGQLSYENAQYKKSLHQYRQALQYYKEGKISREICPILIGMGQVYSREGQLDSALYYFETSLSCSQMHTDTIWEVSSLRSMGNVYFKKGQFDQALKTFHMGLGLAKLLENCIHEESKLYNNLGVLMSEWGEYDKSLTYYRDALLILDSLGNISETSRIYNNMGTIFWYQNKNDSALYYYLLSLKNREKIGDNNGIAFVLNNLGMYYGSLEDYSNSLVYFERSLRLFEKISNRQGIVMTLYNIGSVYQELKNYKLANKYHNQCLSISKSQGFNDYILAAHEALKDVYSELGEWQKAYASLKEFHRLNDSLRKVQNIELLKEMEVSYEHEKNQADLNILKNKMESAGLEEDQSWVFFAGAFVILALLIVSTYLIIWQVRSRTDVEHDKLTPALFRYQMNPQFINSSLSGIKELISKNRVNESSLFLTGFAKLIRTFIETSSSTAIVLEKEIETTQRFLQLHQLRYDQKLYFELELDPKVEPEVLAVPPFVFFPIYVYVVDSHLSKGEVNIQLFIDILENSLLMKLDIKYACKEEDVNADEKDLLLSFDSVKQRIKLLNQAIKDKIIFNHETHLDSHNNQKELKLQINFPIKPS